MLLISALNQKIKNCYTDLEGLIKELNAFEKKYGLPSEQFLKKFKQGVNGGVLELSEYFTKTNTGIRVKKTMGQCRTSRKNFHPPLSCSW